MNRLRKGAENDVAGCEYCVVGPGRLKCNQDKATLYIGKTMSCETKSLGLMVVGGLVRRNVYIYRERERECEVKVA